MKEKIDKINELNRAIKDLEGFLNLLVESSEMSRYRKGDENMLHMFKIASYIWTGDDSVRKERDMGDKDTLKELSEAMRPVLSTRIEKLKSMLGDLIK